MSGGTTEMHHLIDQMAHATDLMPSIRPVFRSARSTEPFE